MESIPQCVGVREDVAGGRERKGGATGSESDGGGGDAGLSGSRNVHCTSAATMVLQLPETQRNIMDYRKSTVQMCKVLVLRGIDRKY